MNVVQTAGAMSVPQGPRGRSGSRGRGVPRGGLKPRDPQDARGEKPNGQRPSNNATRGTDSQHRLKPPPNQGHVRNKTWSNPASLNAAALNAAVQSHAGKIPDLRKEAWRNPARTDSRTYKERMNDLYQTLKQKRERERKAAIKDGFLADPDKPTSLANAITPVGICQEMCPEFERVERIVQLMVDSNEKTPSSTDSDVKVPCEELMVKRFRRSAAGYDEQLPSDIRPPSVLKKTLDYLFNTVVGGPEPLANVHKFVWDRTRGIRNDFSIQQVTKLDDLKTAIDCFERIARFHILSLHQLTRLASENGDFDHHQEREQLNNTLLSLMYYYDDSRHKLISPNEAEFRAYCIVFEIQDQRPDLEDRAQNWPRPVLKDPRVQTALRLYAAAGNISDEQGPLRPRTQFLTAQANTGGFWSLVQSSAVSYMMACVAEIYFNLVRRTALEAIWKAYKGKRGGPTKMEDWTLKDLTFALGFDTEYQTQAFCEEHDFELGDREDGQLYVDLGSVASGNLTDQNPRRKQIFSRNLVESKRLGRTLPAVINGLSAAQAQSRGFIDDSSDADSASMADSESLFINGESDEEKLSQRSRSGSPQNRKAVNGDIPKLNAATTAYNPFASPNSRVSNPSSFQSPGIFGRPSTTASTAQAPSSSTPLFDLKLEPATQQTSGKEIPKFDFHAAAYANNSEATKETPRAPDNIRPSALNIFPSTRKGESTNNSTKDTLSDTAPMGKVFGQPATGLPILEPVKSAHSPFDLPASSVAATAFSQPKDVLDQPSASPAPPSSTLGTSPLFSFEAHEKSEKSKAPNSEGKAPETAATKETPNSFVFPTFTTPTRSTPILFAPTTQQSEVSASKQNEPPKPFKTPYPSFSSISTPPVSPASKQNGTLAPPQSLSLFPKEADAGAALLNQVHSPAQQNIQPSTLSIASNSKSFEGGISQPRPSSLNAKEPQINSRPLLLDKLSDAVMLDDNGLLEQFIEFTVGPIITASIAQLEDEESWEDARKNRTILLSKKYLGRWRTNAWKLGLLRKGRERRRDFARSIKGSIRSPRTMPGDISSSFTSSGSDSASPLIPQENIVNTMPPPAKPANKRQSLPSDLDAHHPQPAAGTITKRKRDDTFIITDEVTPRRTKFSHRRSQTLGGSVMSAPPHRRLSHRKYKPRMDISKVPEGSMLHDTLMKQARRLAPNARSDTTQTDYFRLKALGIDPDTSVVPVTRKRTWKEADLNGIDNTTRSPLQTASPANMAHQPRLSDLPSTTPSAPAPTSADDDDDALFAQIRSVREALAESEQWMHAERQNIERSMTPQTSISPTSAETETPAERRLREIKERGHTPSRSEIRLRAMGDKALLPKGFWDGEGMGRSLIGKGKQREEFPTPKPIGQWQPQPPPRGQRGFAPPMGFAAIGGQGQMNGFGRDEDEGKKGASVEDAIEL